VNQINQIFHECSRKVNPTTVILCNKAHGVAHGHPGASSTLCSARRR
ncbi:hypothetical protein pipiens_000531, partial [Culex pipiens pipiens]